MFPNIYQEKVEESNMAAYGIGIDCGNEECINPQCTCDVCECTEEEPCPCCISPPE